MHLERLNDKTTLRSGCNSLIYYSVVKMNPLSSSSNLDFPTHKLFNMHYIITQGIANKQFRQSAEPAYQASSTKPIMKLYSTTMEGLLISISNYPNINFKIETHDQSKS